MDKAHDYSKIYKLEAKLMEANLKINELEKQLRAVTLKLEHEEESSWKMMMFLHKQLKEERAKMSEKSMDRAEVEVKAEIGLI